MFVEPCPPCRPMWIQIVCLHIYVVHWLLFIRFFIRHKMTGHSVNVGYLSKCLSVVILFVKWKYSSKGIV